MASVNLQFHGLWGLLLGVQRVSLEADYMPAAMRKLEAEYEPLLKEKLREQGAKLDQGLLKASVIILNRENIKESLQQKLNDGDVIHVFPAITGG
jgi:molybdopterin converting factor small subunit